MADRAAKTVTVERMVGGKPMQLAFGVEDGVLSALAGLEPGDQVWVIYVEMGDKRIIRSIGRAKCNRSGPRRAPSEVSPASFPPEAH